MSVICLFVCVCVYIYMYVGVYVHVYDGMGQCTRAFHYEEGESMCA
jgi:hypothetical protein